MIYLNALEMNRLSLLKMKFDIDDRTQNGNKNIIKDTCFYITKFESKQ